MARTLGKLRCAVLSAIKHDYVARGIASHPRFELAVVGDDPHIPEWAHERNRSFADEFRIPYIRDVDACLSNFDVQVAIVSPEAERHCDLSIRAARAAKHIVQDKPLATSRLAAEQLVAAVEQQQVRFMMWNRNYLPAVVHAREQIEQGKVGRIVAIHADFYFAKNAGPFKGSRQPGYPPLNWTAHQIAAHVDGSDGGLGSQPMGELAIEGIYPLAYIRWLTGAAVHRVFARSTAHFHQLYVDNQVEDLASLSLEMDRQVTGTIAIGRIGAASHPSGGEIKLHILGTRGALVVRESLPEVGIYHRQQPATEPRPKRVAVENDFLLAADFAQAIDGNHATILDIHDSFAIYATCEAALESCRIGQAVDVQLTAMKGTGLAPYA